MKTVYGVYKPNFDKSKQASLQGKPQSEGIKARTAELFDADPKCEHVVVPAGHSGVKCTKCRGWFCF